MSTSSAPRSWALQCSDDNVSWQIVHIATEQKEWHSEEERTFSLSGLTQLPLVGRFSGIIEIVGAIYQTATNVNSHFVGGIQIGGFAPMSELTLSGHIVARIPSLVYAVFDRSLASLQWASPGHVAVGGHIQAFIERNNIKGVYTTDQYYFKGRTPISGKAKGTLPNLVPTFKLMTIINAQGVLAVKTIEDIKFIGAGKSLAGGGYSGILKDITGIFRGSNTILTMSLKLSSDYSSIYLRTSVSGHIDAKIDDSLTTAFKALIPPPLYITGNMHTESIKLFFRVVVETLVTMGSVLDPVRSVDTHAVTYYGQMIRRTQSIALEFFGKAGPPVVGKITTTTASPTSKWLGIGHLFGSFISSVVSGRGNLFILVPSATYGKFITSLNNVVGNIHLKNFKWFKTEWADLRTVSLIPNIGGLILIGGHWKSFGSHVESIAVYGQFKMVIPIPIKAASHPVLNPVFSLGTFIGFAPLYGKAELQLKDVESRKFIGNSNTGRMQIVTDVPSVKIKLLTIVHVTGNLASVFNRVIIVLFGRISTLGKIQIEVPDYLIGQFRAHTPITAQPIYGLMKSTLGSVVGNIFVKLRLQYGTINQTLDHITPIFKGWCLCYGTFSTTTATLRIFVAVHLDHFVGTFSTTTTSPTAFFKAHSRILVTLASQLSVIKWGSLNTIVPVFRGYINLDIGKRQDSIIPAYNGGVSTDISLIYKYLLYGRIESTTKSLQYAEFFGIVPRVVYGRMLPTLGNATARFNTKITNMGRMIATTGIESIRNPQIYGAHNIGRLAIQHLDFDIYKSQFQGQAAHAIIGLMTVKINSERIVLTTDHYAYPLQIFIKGMTPIYGTLFGVLKGVTSVYFRSANSTLGKLVGGDIHPTASCVDSPCIWEIQQSLGRYFNVGDKIYWTLGWVKGRFQGQHRFPIIGRLYSADIEANTVPGSSTTKLHGNILTNVPVFGTLDVNMQSYVDWGSGLLIYGQFKGFTVKGPMKITLKELKGGFVLNITAYTYGTMAADLKPMNGQGGGFHVLKGDMKLKDAGLSMSIGARVPIHYQATAHLQLDLPSLNLQLYTPITTFGVLRNAYLDEVTVFGSMSGYIPVYVTLSATLIPQFKRSDFYGRMMVVIGTFIPTSKLGNVRSQIIMQTVTEGGYAGATTAYFLAKLGNVLTSQIFLRANIYENVDLHTAPVTGEIKLRTPIRIWTYWTPNYLDALSSIIMGTVWPAGRFTRLLDAIKSDFTTIYKIPIYFNLEIPMDLISSNIMGRVLIGGTFHSTLQDVKLTSQSIYGRYGIWNSILEEFDYSMALIAYQTAKQLPLESKYRIAGQVGNLQTKQRTYSMFLYSRVTGELVQKLPLNTMTPFDYSFGLAPRGDYLVVCRPSQVVVGSKVHFVQVFFEKDSIFN